MIRSKQDYLNYLKADRIHQVNQKKRSLGTRIIYLFIGRYDVSDFLQLLRKVEYYQNCKKSQISKGYCRYLRAKLYADGVKLGFYINPNCIGPGLSISHPGTIIISQIAKVGANCRINPCVVIGQNRGKAPKIGNNVFIGAGAKVIGDITIADGIAIGANSVVNKSFLEPNITIAGIPAKKVSYRGSKGLIIDATGILNT